MVAAVIQGYFDAAEVAPVQTVPATEAIPLVTGQSMEAAVETTVPIPEATVPTVVAAVLNAEPIVASDR